MAITEISPQSKLTESHGPDSSELSRIIRGQCGPRILRADYIRRNRTIYQYIKAVRKRAGRQTGRDRRFFQLLYTLRPRQRQTSRIEDHTETRQTKQQTKNRGKATQNRTASRSISVAAASANFSPHFCYSHVRRSRAPVWASMEAARPVSISELGYIRGDHR